jgi:hypothetical protein
MPECLSHVTGKPEQLRWCAPMQLWLATQQQFSEMCYHSLLITVIIHTIYITYNSGMNKICLRVYNIDKIMATTVIW